MQTKVTTMPWAVAGLAIVLAVVFSVTNLALAKHGADDGRKTNSSVPSGATSVNDDGTADQGRGDVVVSPAPTPTPAPSPTPASAPTGATNAFVQIEADVFTDVTLVKVEKNDVKSFYETSTRDRSLLVIEVASHFGLDPALVSNVLDFELEDRASRARDRR